MQVTDILQFINLPVPVQILPKKINFIHLNQYFFNILHLDLEFNLISFFEFLLVGFHDEDMFFLFEILDFFIGEELRIPWDVFSHLNLHHLIHFSRLPLI